MVTRVAIIGGYGNFGSHVARSLAGESNITLIIAGRDRHKAQAFAKSLASANPAEAAVVDLRDPAEAVAAMKPDLVINMVGPYHDQPYTLARAAIACGAHYCDIADAREFVAGIGVLDEAAREAGVAVLAGASSVPTLTAAYLDEAAKVMTLRRVNYGISAGEQSNHGSGTVAAVLRFVGERFTMLRGGKMKAVTGWSGTHSVTYPELGRRWFGRANIADHALFPQRYPGLTDLTFWAGHGIAFMHFSTIVLAFLRRLRLLPRLDRLASPLAKVSRLFDPLGRGLSGFHMVTEGEDAQGKPVKRRHWIIARHGHGPYIPSTAVIILARMLAAGKSFAPGARPCLDILTLDDYRAGFAGLDISWIDE